MPSKIEQAEAVLAYENAAAAFRAAKADRADDPEVYAEAKATFAPIRAAWKAARPKGTVAPDTAQLKAVPEKVGS